MKKSTHIILYTVLFVAMLFLAFKQFSKSNNVQPKKEKASNKANFINNNSTSRIAYVNSDTVSKYYNYAIKIQKTLSTKRIEAEKQIKSKYFSYESLVKDFEKASPIMGDREKMEKAQKIRMLEQEIMQVEQQLS